MAWDRDDSPRRPSVVLVSLPWTSLTEPSLGLGILRAQLDREAIPCRVLHLNLFLLEHLRARSYYALANVFALNDFLFSGVLEPGVSHRQRQWLRLKAEELLSFDLIDERQYNGIDGVIAQLLRLRQEVIPEWLSRWAGLIADTEATLVGLTCMFDQTLASVALAHLVKQKAPDKLVALGGYAVRQPTGEALLKAFPCVDVVCIGEGEPVIVALAHAANGELPLSEVPSILYRAGDQSVLATPIAAPVDMNSIPPPNYDDFFADLKTLADDYQVEVEVDRLPMENSRGCWWGQKQHCVFCGIHDDDLAFRSRDAVSALAVMDALADRYEMHSFRFSDYILPHQYFKTLLPELARRGAPYRITSEIKANINAEQFALMAAAGFEEVQPGIESFSSNVQRKMAKGVSAIQSIYALLLGKRHEVAVRYNILYGLPDDEPEDIAAMVDALPLLFHLDPPSTRLPIQITRFAPLQVAPARFGISSSMYEPSYDLVFSQDFLANTGFDFNDYCYYFERPFENSPRLRRLYAEIDSLVDRWKRERERRDIALRYCDTAAGIEIFDSRKEPAELTRLGGGESAIYRHVGTPVAVQSLWLRCQTEMERGEFDAALASLQRSGFLFRDGGQVIGLALPDSQPPASGAVP